MNINGFGEGTQNSIYSNLEPGTSKIHTERDRNSNEKIPSIVHSLFVNNEPNGTTNLELNPTPTQLPPDDFNQILHEDEEEIDQDSEDFIEDFEEHFTDVQIDKQETKVEEQKGFKEIHEGKNVKAFVSEQQTDTSDIEGEHKNSNSPASMVVKDESSQGFVNLMRDFSQNQENNLIMQTARNRQQSALNDKVDLKEIFQLEQKKVKLEQKEVKVEQKKVKVEQKKVKVEGKEVKLEQKKVKVEQKEVKVDKGVFQQKLETLNNKKEFVVENMSNFTSETKKVFLEGNKSLSNEFFLIKQKIDSGQLSKKQCEKEFSKLLQLLSSATHPDGTRLSKDEINTYKKEVTHLFTQYINIHFEMKKIEEQISNEEIDKKTVVKVTENNSSHYCRSTFSSLIQKSDDILSYLNLCGKTSSLSHQAKAALMDKIEQLKRNINRWRKEEHEQKIAYQTMIFADRILNQRILNDEVPTN
jgi:hypothetical protein